METSDFHDKKRGELGSHELGAVALPEQLCMRRKGDMTGVQALGHERPIFPNGSRKNGVQGGPLRYLWCCGREGEQN